MAELRRPRDSEASPALVVNCFNAIFNGPRSSESASAPATEFEAPDSAAAAEAVEMALAARDDRRVDKDGHEGAGDPSERDVSSSIGEGPFEAAPPS